MRLQISLLCILAALLSNSSRAQVTVNRYNGIDDYVNVVFGDTAYNFPNSRGTNLSVYSKVVFPRWATPYINASNYTSAHVLTTGPYTNAYDVIMEATNRLSGTYGVGGWNGYGFDSNYQMDESFSSSSAITTNRGIAETVTPRRTRGYSEAHARDTLYTTTSGSTSFKRAGEAEFLNLNDTVGNSATVDYQISWDGYSDSSYKIISASDNWDIRVLGSNTNSLRYRLTGFDPEGSIYMNMFYNQFLGTNGFNVNCTLYPPQLDPISAAWTIPENTPLDINSLIYSNDLEDTLATEIFFTNGGPFVLYNGATQYSSNVVVLDSWDETNDYMIVTIPAGTMDRDGFAWIQVDKTTNIFPLSQYEYWNTPIIKSLGYSSLPWNPWQWQIPCSTNEFTIQITAVSTSNSKTRYGYTGMRLYNIDPRRHVFSTLDQDGTNTNYVRNTNCWLQGIDLTPFSPWNSRGDRGDDGGRRAGALITPQHMVNADHYLMLVGNKVRFITEDNQIVERTITKSEGVYFSDNDFGYADGYIDLRIYELDSPVPDSIGFCSVLPTNWPSYFYSLSGAVGALITQAKTIQAVAFGINGNHPTLQMRQWMDCSFYTNFVPDIVNDHSIGQPQNGDSASPVFLSINGTTILMSVATSTVSGPPFSIMQKEINAQLEAWGSEYRLTEFDLSTLNP